jgi:hypothetical protein
MSNAIAPSTSLLVPSVLPEPEYPFGERLLTLAARKSGGTIRASYTLKSQALIDSLRNDYRCHYAGIYGKSDKLPSAVIDKIRSEVDLFLARMLAGVNSSNVISSSKKFIWRENDKDVMERVVLTGENELTMQEQRDGIDALIYQSEKRLKSLENKKLQENEKLPHYEKIKKLASQILRMNSTKLFIEAEIQHQQELAKQK